MKIYNTMTRKKEEFTPLNESSVGMYVCGPTVYDLMHIGNARPLSVFDTVRRYFLYKGWKVNYVQNFTDVDDKIIARGHEMGTAPEAVADMFINEALVDMRGLNCMEPDAAPRATQEMDGIVAMVQTLIDKGHAYAVNGSVYYSSRSFPGYGRLSGKDLDDLNAGARVEVNDEKRDPLDFVLWKPHKPGEPKWPSPWGEGRPGWHIECSVMSKKYLGGTFDIHAGGEDLIFPHHENEIAQSEAANGATFARYWMHVGFININNEKMSKSLGNFRTLRKVADEYSYEAVRFFILSAHYRSPVNFSDEPLNAAKNALERIKNCARLLKELAGGGLPNDAGDEVLKGAQAFVKRFEDSMEDDFNTANAISAIFDLVTYINVQAVKPVSKIAAASLLGVLSKLCGVLGIDPLKEKQADADKTADIEALIAKRQEARKSKDFKAADAIRAQLSDMGVVLEDRPDGPRWSLK